MYSKLKRNTASMRIILVLPCLSLIFTQGFCAPRRLEALLLDHLMTNYSKLVPPFTFESPTNVTFGIELIQLLKVDDRAQIITTKVWVRQSWTNPFLAWDPKQWNGIYMLMVEPLDVWVPDVVLYESTDPHKAGGTNSYDTQILLQANGHHTWFSPAVFTSTCKINIKNFPFDHQECCLKFGSYFYDVTNINMQTNERDAISSNYIHSTEWDVENVEKQKNIVKYSCCPHPYADVTFKLHLRRKPSFYVFNVIFPCLVLAFTILFSFLLPPESGERIGLNITILLAMAVLMQVISTTLPASSDDTPRLSVFYMVVLIESGLSLVITCAVLTLHYRGEEIEPHPMPPWVRKIFIDILGSRLGITTAKEKIDKLHASDGGYEVQDNGQLQNEEDRPTRNIRKRSMIRSRKIENLETLQDGEPEVDNEEIDTKEIVTPNKDWKTLGKVIDRLSFLVFCLVSVISAASILIPAYLHSGHL